MASLAAVSILFGAYTAAQADGHGYIERMNETTAAEMLPVSGVPAGQWMHMPKSVCKKMCDARPECGMFVVSDIKACALFGKKAVNAAVDRAGFTAFVKPYVSKKKAAAVAVEKQDIAETAKEEMIKQAVEDTKAESVAKEKAKPAAKKEAMAEDPNGDIELSLDDLMN